MIKPKLNQPDVEITTTTFGESITINQTIPSKQFNDIFVTGTIVEEYIPTLKDVKKEWEDKGWGWSVCGNEIYIGKDKKSICINITNKTISYNCESLWENQYWLELSFQECQLLTKTIKALEVEKCKYLNIL